MPDATATIDARAARVWHALTTPEEMSLWMGYPVRTADGGPVGAGSDLLFEARGKTRTAHVTAFEPGRGFAIRSVQGAVTAEYRYGVAGNGPTTATLDIACRARGAMRLALPLLRPLIRRTDAPQLRRLKDLVEATAAA